MVTVGDVSARRIGSTNATENVAGADRKRGRE
jgi:hypothetical protein